MARDYSAQMDTTLQGAILKKLKNMRSVREARRISQVDLAKVLRTNQSNVSQWETGKTKPWPHTVEKIAAALSCSPDDLR
jgi:transcriptional regulator with XRE-family HTH domain